MAKSAKGAGSFLVPLIVVTVGVVAIMVITFSFSGEEVPDEATIIAEDDVDERPAGAGTVPEGAADENMEGASDQLDEVDPAAEGEDQVPAADMATDGSDDSTEGETNADEETAETTGDTGGADAAAGDAGSAEGAAQEDAAQADEDSASSEESRDGQSASEDASGQNGSTGEAARLVDDGGEGEGTKEDSYLVDEESDAPASADVDRTEEDQDRSMPAGRDTQTELTPEPGQDVVEDSDDGGAAFIPTPSGPDGDREE